MTPQQRIDHFLSSSAEMEDSDTALFVNSTVPGERASASFGDLRMLSARVVELEDFVRRWGTDTVKGDKTQIRIAAEARALLEHTTPPRPQLSPVDTSPGNLVKLAEKASERTVFMDYDYARAVWAHFHALANEKKQHTDEKLTRKNALLEVCRSLCECCRQNCAVARYTDLPPKRAWTHHGSVCDAAVVRELLLQEDKAPLVEKL